MTVPSVVPPADSDNLKQCTKCDEWKPKTAFSVDRASHDGLQRRCKACNRQYRNENRAGRRAYLDFHRDVIRDQQRKWRAANRERINENKRAYRNANREQVNAQQRAYYAENAWKWAQYRVNHREQRMEYQRAYRTRYVKSEGGRAAVYASNHRRRARVLNLPNELSPRDMKSALESFNGCCAVCGRPPGLWHTIAMDHWVPLSKGGGTTPDNIVPLCHAKKDGEGGCNNSKKDRDALEWLIEKYGPRKGRAVFNRIQDWLDRRDRLMSGAGE